jgi:hypothetical protein
MNAIARQGLIGNAYNSAFNTAIGAGAQDSANQLTAGTTNANLGETALNRQAPAARPPCKGLQSQQLGSPDRRQRADPAGHRRSSRPS